MSSTTRKFVGERSRLRWGVFPARGSPGALAVLAAAAASASRAATYEVGPGQPLAAVGDVPWESLAPGDEVRIHWRAEPYREKFVVAVQGTAERPVVIRGIPNERGEPPVIDGRDATTRAALDFWNENRGVIKIGGANAPDCDAPDCVPSWITIEGLDVRSARPPYAFSSARGGGDYADNAAAIYVEVGRRITIRNCRIHDSGNGLFIGAYDGLTEDILVEGNWIYDNGIEGSIYEHNSYTAARGITFQFNHYGSLRAGCGGNNLKDRSAGLVVRYNWIENGNRQLDLVDGEDTAEIPGDPRYRTTFVYGNVLVEGPDEGNSQIVHYGGDSGDESLYRKGTLYFHNNTVVSTRDGNTTLFRLSTNDERCDARNNVFYVSAPGDRLALCSGTGRLDLSHNWFKPGFVATHDTLEGTIADDGTAVTGDDPGFVDRIAQDFHLAAGSPCIDAGTDLAAAVLPDHDVLFQYVAHQAGEPRPLEPPFDLGAFERCVSGACGAAGADAGADAGGDVAGDAVPPDGGDAEAGDDTGGGCGCRAAGAGAAGEAAGLLAGWLAVRLRRRLRGRRGVPPEPSSDLSPPANRC